MTANNETIVAYKGFDKDWKCRGFQYEIGKTYIHQGDAVLCEAGFHACEAPLDVWNYYKLSGSNFAQVELSGVSEKKDGDSKRCGTSITVKLAFTLPMLIKAQVEWVFARADNKKIATGRSGHAASTGDSGHAAATGDYGHAASTGDSGHAAATGRSGHAAATGDSGHAASTGDSGHAAATGDFGCAFAGFKGKAKASKSGSFAIAFFDGTRSRLVVGTPGDNGIKADTFYEVDGNGQLKECDK